MKTFKRDLPIKKSKTINSFQITKTLEEKIPKDMYLSKIKKTILEQRKDF